MIKEALEPFVKKLEENGDRIITDSYIPKDGTYRIVEIDGYNYEIKKTLEISKDKKTGEILGSVDIDYPYICKLDYYSKLIVMNKPIGPKKIHTNNYLSLAIKKEDILNGIDNSIFDRYYKILRNPYEKYRKKKKTNELYMSVEDEIGKPDENNINIIEKIVLSGVLWSDVDLTKKDYLKIFFVFKCNSQEDNIELYRSESKRYILPNIYNNTDFNILDNNVIFGPPNNNICLNSKKPYLENKTRKMPVPYLVSKDEVLIQAKLFDYLWAIESNGKNHIYVEDGEICGYSNEENPKKIDSGYYFRIKKGNNEAEIQYADVVPSYKPELPKEFLLKDYMHVKTEYSKLSDKDKYSTYIYKLWEIKEFIDKGFFDGKLERNLDTEPKDIKFLNDNTELKSYFLKSREPLSRWFYTGNTVGLEDFIKNTTLKIIENSMKNIDFDKAGTLYKVREQFNLRWSLADYFYPDRSEGVKMNKILADLREKINLPKNEDWDFSSDEEYSFAVGQIVRFLVSLSKAKNVTHSAINPFLNTTKYELIKKSVLNMYERYNYAIELNENSRFDKLFSHMLNYTPEKIYKEQIMAGFVSNILIYEKSNKENDTEVEE